jgi:hypothetical protein
MFMIPVLVPCLRGIRKLLKTLQYNQLQYIKIIAVDTKCPFDHLPGFIFQPVYLLPAHTGDEDEKMPEHSIVKKIKDNFKALANIYAIVHKVGSAVDRLKSNSKF